MTKDQIVAALNGVVDGSYADEIEAEVAQRWRDAVENEPEALAVLGAHDDPFVKQYLMVTWAQQIISKKFIEIAKVLIDIADNVE